MVIQDRVRTGLKALTEEYTERFAPAFPEEKSLVDTLAICEWRSRLYMRTEAEILEHEPDASAGRAAKHLDRLHRMIDSTQRTFSSTLRLLMAVQAKNRRKPATSGLFLVPKR